MNINYIKIFIVLLFIVGLSTPFSAQACFRESEPEETQTETDLEETPEEFEGSAEESDLSFDVGAEDLEMNVSESDMIGTEVGEELVGEVGEELAGEAAGEIIGETLASSVIADAIPVVGEVVMALGALAAVGYTIYSMFESEQERNRREELKSENEHVKKISGGTYRLPLFPEFRIHGQDLNGKKGKVSYILYLKKNIGQADVKNYLIQHGLDNHISKSYPLKKLNNNLAYAFSEFTRDAHYGYSKKTYKRTIPEISLYSKTLFYFKPTYKEVTSYSGQKMRYKYITKHSRQELFYKYTTKWRHNFHGKDNNNKPVSLNTEMALNIDQPLDFWTAYINKETGAFEYISKIDRENISIEDSDKNLMIRIKDVDISSYQISSRQELVITLRTKRHKYFLEKGGKYIFPENWNPTKGSGKLSYCKNLGSPCYAPFFGAFCLTYSFKDRYDCSNHPFENKDLYPNTYGERPDVTDSNLFYFRVHDYQPFDTKESIGKSKDLSQINVFPTVRKTFHNNTPSGRIWPKPGFSNIRIDIPPTLRHKKLSYIELEGVSKKNNVILTFYLKDSKYRLTKARYYDHLGDEKTITVRSVISDRQNESLSFPIHSGDIFKIREKMSIFLENAPFQTGEILDAKVYYTDGSFSRKIIKLVEEENRVPTGYYSFFRELRGINTYLSYRRFLIEYHPYTNSYTILDKSKSSEPTQNMLGIIDGKVGFYEWNPEEPGLHWLFDFSEKKYSKLVKDGSQKYWDISSRNNKFKLFNIGQQAYLDYILSEGDKFSFSDGTVFFVGEKVVAEPFFEGQKYISDRINYHLLRSDGSRNVTLLTGANRYEESLLDLKYVGAQRYLIYNRRIKKYLHLENDHLKWKTNSNSYWSLIKNDNYFALATNNKVLFFDSDSDTGIGIKSLADSELTEYKYQFRIKDEFNYDPIAHYAFEDNAKDSSGNNHHGTAHGGLTYENDPKRGKVAKFDGEDDYVNTHFYFDPKEYDGTLTIGLWMKSDKVINGPRFFIGNDNYHIFQTIYEIENSIKYYIWANLGIYNSRSFAGASLYNGIFIDNRWYYLTYVIDKQDDGKIRQTIYMDGVRYDSHNLDGRFLNTINGGNTIIGKAIEDLTSCLFQGLMDDVKIWGRALSEQQIKEEYDKTKLGSIKLIAHYAFEDNAKDSSGNNHHGTAHGGLTYENDPKRGKVAKFDGEDDYVNTHFYFDPNDYDGTLTIGFWMKSDKVNNQVFLIGNDNYIISQTMPEVGSTHYIWGSLSMDNSFVYEGIDLYDQGFIDNRWHYLTYVIDKQEDGKTRQTIYMDGIRYKSHIQQGFSLSTVNGGNTIIGNAFEDARSSFYKGLMDDVKIWGRALTDQQVKKEYDKSNLDLTKLIAHYAFKDNTNDISGNNHHGTAYGGLTYENDTERGKVAKFDGQDDYVDTHFDFHPDDYEGELTASLWMKTDDFGDDLAGLIYADSWSIRHNKRGNGISFYGHYNINGEIGEHSFEFNNSLADNNWHHITIVIQPNSDSSGSIRKLYVDGIKKESEPFSSKYQRGFTNTIIGKVYYTEPYLANLSYKGLMDDVKIWKVALSAELIKSEYESGKTNTRRTGRVLTVSSAQKSNGLLVYPNPASSVLNIKTDKEIISSQIVSYGGHHIKSFASQKEIDVSDIKQGTYILKVLFSDGSVETAKFIIAKQ